MLKDLLQFNLLFIIFLQGRVQQFYVTQCSEVSDEQKVANVQCANLPANCNQPPQFLRSLLRSLQGNTVYISHSLGLQAFSKFLYNEKLIGRQEKMESGGKKKENA